MRKSNSKGFTFFELILTMAIIAILAGVLVPLAFRTYRNVRHEQVITDISMTLDALSSFCNIEETTALNAASCQLNGVSSTGNEWSGANPANRDPLLNELLEKYAEGRNFQAFTARIDLSGSNWLSAPDQSCVSLWYPSIDADGNRVYDTVSSVLDFDAPVYTQAEWQALAAGFDIHTSFICDMDGDGPDDEDDFYISTVYFRLNDSHGHAVIAESNKGSYLGETLIGTNGVDTLEALGGDDTLIGLRDDDVLNGGEGTDTALFMGSWIDYVLDDSDGYRVIGLEGTDVLISIELLKFDDYTATFAEVQHAQDSAIKGTSGDDNLIGTALADVMAGFAGNDTFSGYADDDTIFGGSGTDTAIYTLEQSNYTISGYEPYIVSGPVGVDKLYSVELIKFSDTPTAVTIESIVNPPPNVVINGTVNDDVIVGTLTSGNIINGLEGGDNIVGLQGDDTINGDEGNDILNGGYGDDTINGGAGTDTVVFNGFIAQYEITGINPYLVNGPDGIDVLTDVEYVEFADQGATDITTLVSIMTNIIMGTEYGEVITGDKASGNEIYGLNGDDIIQALGGDDELYGGAGDDSLQGNGGDDLLDGGTGTDTAVYTGIRDDYTIMDMGGGNYRVTGPEGTDDLTDVENIEFSDLVSTPIADLIAPVTLIITGTTGDDALVGNTSDDIINALEGNDLITGLEGNDTIDGGPGTDTVVVADSLAVCHIQQVSSGVYSVVTLTQGTDEITNVEIINFAGTDVAIIDSSASSVSGSGGADIFIYNDNDTINCDVTDVIVFPGDSSNYTIKVQNKNRIYVTDNTSGHQLLLVSKAELHFNDQIIDLDS